jgi:hypothetical protein
MSVASVLCPVHHKLVIAHRDDFPACLQCEVNRLREWLEGIRNFAERRAHGGGAAALLQVAVASGQALSGVAEEYQYRDRPQEITPTTGVKP